MAQTSVLSAPRTWPLTLRVPLLAAFLVIAVAVGISSFVLERFQADQEASLSLLANAYMDGLTEAVRSATIRKDVWETFDVLDNARRHYSGLAPRYTIVLLPNDTVLAATDPVRFPVRSLIDANMRTYFPAKDGLRLDGVSGNALITRRIREEGLVGGTILSEIDISTLLRARNILLASLVAFNGILALAAAVIGYVSIKRMLSPLDILSDHVEQARIGQVKPIASTMGRIQAPEFSRLFDRFNAMATAMREREMLTAQLAAQESQVVLGRVAATMAHEVNNPLGGLFNALNTLRRHGADVEARDASLHLLERGMIHIKDIVRSMLAVHRPQADSEPLTHEDIDDLRLLIAPQLNRRKLAVEWTNRLTYPIPVNAASVRQIALNLLLNAITSASENGLVRFCAYNDGSALYLLVADDGRGFDASKRAELESMVILPPSPGAGLGHWIVKRLVQENNGLIQVDPANHCLSEIQIMLPFRSSSGLRNESEATESTQL
ncbi:MAG: HAMP domain-containing histidine kinase [Hyphomicrobiales bacterium]|nr:HAMP domain-containing histidine kinase [Hyphomicrobiales bacterium]MDE2115936.1 HAMP domain-containing histidine kinase [Hyphomicrobiales bacterium]